MLPPAMAFSEAAGFMLDGAAVGAECVVCLDALRPADRVRMLPCVHVFHECCADRWLRRARTCPLCKQDVLRAAAG